jgi:proteasome lid subunit RPN8/RPN11
MHGLRLNLEVMATWQTPLCPFAIEFVPDKLDEIRIAVIEGFYAVPHGGLEIGGLLYGTREEDRIRIEDYRKVETEYLTGPSFHLSENDRSGLRKLLAERAPVEESGALEVVGWYHSHTRSGIHLSMRDLEVFEEFFPKPWQIALVLKPENMGPVRGGYFFRDKDGNIEADASASEFALHPAVGEKKTRGRAETPRLRKVVASRPEAPAPMVVAEPEDYPVPVPEMFVAASPGRLGFPPLMISMFIIILVSAGLAGYWLATNR